MKFLKQKNISRFSITDNSLFFNSAGVGPGNRVVIDASGGLMLPKGTTAQRPQLTGVRQPTDANGTIRYNTSTSSLEAYINNNWEIVRAAGSSTISKQTLGPGDGNTITFGPLIETPSNPGSAPFDYPILVLIENVVQISTTNYTLLYNYLGSGDTYISFTSPVPIDKYITIYFGFGN